MTCNELCIIIKIEYAVLSSICFLTVPAALVEFRTKLNAQ